MLHTTVILFISAFFFCFIIIPYLEELAKRKGFLTKTCNHKIDKRNIPYLGGLAFILVFLLLSSAGYFMLPQTMSVRTFVLFLVVAFLIALFGFLDDVRELSPGKKLIAQFAGSLVVVLWVFRTQIVYLNAPLNIGASLLWFMVMVNALNLLDIMDGLAGSISLVNTVSFLVFGIIFQNYFVVLIGTVLSGILIAFLCFNLPPARIFMGDTGSQFLGFVQASMAVSLSFATSGHAAALVVPLVVLSVPLFDLAFVIMMRIRQGKSIFQKSNDHFVYHMLNAGISKTKILKIMVGLSLFTNLCAFLIYGVSNILGMIIFLPLMGALFYVGFKLSRFNKVDG